MDKLLTTLKIDTSLPPKLSQDKSTFSYSFLLAYFPISPLFFLFQLFLFSLLTFVRVRELYEGQFTNEISRLEAFAPTEYWIFQFDKYNLYNHILSVKFRAHPRAGRRITLKLRDPRGFNPFCADDNWVDVTGPNCKKNFEVKTYQCTPNDQNKGKLIISSLSFFLSYFLFVK